VNVSVTISTVLGELMLHLYTANTGTLLRELPPEGAIRCSIPRCPLPPGRYVMNVWADVGGEILDWIQRASELTVVEGDFYGVGRAGHLPSHTAVLVEHSWTIDTPVSEQSVTTGRAV
jgi:lipopolysaccharide transport system ATP-binding protein